MARFAVNLPSGRTGHEGFFRLLGKTLTGSGVLGTGDLAVSAQPTPDMSVRVPAGDVAIFSGAILYHGWSTAVENVTIPANSSGVTKITAVVASINLAGAVDDPNNPNNPNALVFQTFTLGGTDTSTPTDAQISTGIGGRPFHRLGNVTVANGATSINAGNIADTRANAAVGRVSIAPGSVGTAALASESWAPYTPTWTGSTTNPTLGNGTLAAEYYKVGRLVTVRLVLVIGSTTSIGSGRWCFSLPIPPKTSNGLNVGASGSAYYEKKASQGYAASPVILPSDDVTAAQRDALALLFPSGSSTRPAPTPWDTLTSTSIAWAANDYLASTFTYEAAS